MTKLRNPLLSLKASGTLGRMITFVRRKGVDLVEKKPEIKDAKSPAQLIWRHMYSKCTALWHELSGAEQQEWESQARSRHMTGYAWFISQCLRPNPGIYLPLQGGTMSGDIDMAGNKITDLPAPVGDDDAASKRYVDASSTPAREGARVYHSVSLAVPMATYTILAFNSERYDTDLIHDNAVSNSRLTCKTAGKYVIAAIVRWETGLGYQRRVVIRLNGTTDIGYHMIAEAGNSEEVMNPVCIYDLSVDDYVEVRVYQNLAATLDVPAIGNYSPEFMMSRIG